LPTEPVEEISPLLPNSSLSVPMMAPVFGQIELPRLKVKWPRWPFDSTLRL